MKGLSVAACAVAATALLAAEPVEVSVDSMHPTYRVSKDLYGLFLEDISLSVDGCFYPELVWHRGKAEGEEHYTAYYPTTDGSGTVAAVFTSRMLFQPQQIVLIPPGAEEWP